jgi:hypothetical protein
MIPHLDAVNLENHWAVFSHSPHVLVRVVRVLEEGIRDVVFVGRVRTILFL